MSPAFSTAPGSTSIPAHDRWQSVRRFPANGRSGRLIADLGVEIGELRLQFLDARMIAEQRRRLLGELGSQRHPLRDGVRIDSEFSTSDDSIGLPL